jgi:hypothetical protein
LVRLQQIDILKQAAQLLLGLDAAFVGTGFQPDYAVTIEVWFVESLGDSGSISLDARSPMSA